MVKHEPVSPPPAEEVPRETPVKKPEPELPASFFADLIHQPRCKRDGVCDNCGRCEH